MNFQDIHPVPRAKTLIDIAFAAGRKKMLQKKLHGTWSEKIKAKERRKVDIVAAQLTASLESIVRSFPSFSHLPPFYQKLVALTLEEKELRQSLGAIPWAQRKIRDFQRITLRQLNQHSTGKVSSAAFYGRVSSVLKQIDSALAYLERARYVMRTYPDVKEMPTACVYGFPNVGKTTLLNELTGAKAKVASYAFTTLGINSGFMNVEGKDIQLLDVPGTLARSTKKNPIELQAELVVEELAAVIIFVMDLSETSGYSVELQEQLFRDVQKLGKPVILYLSKQDLLDKKIVEKRQKPVLSVGNVRKELLMVFS